MAELLRRLSVCLLVCLAPGCTVPSMEGDRVSSIQVLGFSGCPNTPELLYRVKQATVRSGIDASVVYLDQQALGESDVRRGYPAPTVLVNGHDLYGLPVRTSPGSSCRLYAGGLPGTADITDRLLAVNEGQ